MSSFVAIAPVPTATRSTVSPRAGAPPGTSCLACHRRKVRCNRHQPCSHCLRLKSECVYQAPRPRRKRNPASDDAAIDRLKHYEELLDRHGIARDGIERPSFQKVEAASNSREPCRSPITSLNPDAALVSRNGVTRFFDSLFWRISKPPGESIAVWDKMNDERSASATAQHSGMLFGPEAVQIARPRIPYDTAMRLWRTYCERVEPIIKILHRPTVHPVIQATAADPSTASVPARCITYAVYHMALVSLSDDECRLMMDGQPRDEACQQSRMFLQQLLVESDLLRSTELHVLQALMMLLISVRGTYDAQVLWMLSGVAVRLAQSMGLHRDGQALGLAPFETEVRRRIFWQIPQIDGFSSQLCGTGISLDPNSYDTKLPSSFNDEDIRPGMERPPSQDPQSSRATDMIYWLAKAELVQLYLHTKEWSFLYRPVSDDYQGHVAAATKQVDATEDALESTILRYCDPVIPVHLLTLVTCRAALYAQRFRILLPLAKAGLADEATRSKMTGYTLRVVDYVSYMQTDPALTIFLWHTCVFYCWDNLIWILGEIARPAADIDRDMAWSKLDKVFLGNITDQIRQKKPMAVAIGQLALKTWTNLHPGGPSPSDPLFMNKLRSIWAQPKSGSPLPPTATTDASENPHSSDMMPGGPNQSDVSGLDGDSVLVGDDVDWQFWDDLLKDPELLRPPPV